MTGEKKVYEVQVKQMDYYNYQVSANSEEEAIEMATDLHNRLVDKWEQECDDSDMDVYVY